MEIIDNRGNKTEASGNILAHKIKPPTNKYKEGYIDYILHTGYSIRLEPDEINTILRSIMPNNSFEYSIPEQDKLAEDSPTDIPLTFGEEGGE